MLTKCKMYLHKSMYHKNDGNRHKTWVHTGCKSAISVVYS